MSLSVFINVDVRVHPPVEEILLAAYALSIRTNSQQRLAKFHNVRSEEIQFSLFYWKLFCFPMHSTARILNFATCHLYIYFALISLRNTYVFYNTLQLIVLNKEKKLFRWRITSVMFHMALSLSVTSKNEKARFMSGTVHYSNICILTLYVYIAEQVLFLVCGGRGERTCHLSSSLIVNSTGDIFFTKRPIGILLSE